MYVLFIDKNLKEHKVFKENKKRFEDNVKDKTFKKNMDIFKVTI